MFSGELLAVGWSHTSAYIIAVIGYDRFLHMKYLNRYSQVVKIKRTRFVTCLVLCLSFAHIGTQSLGKKFSFSNALYDKIFLNLKGMMVFWS